jgi:methylmalonyl-CoA/ethylmalonyl-CoA epimerase
MHKERSPVMIKGIGHIGIAVHNIEESLAAVVKAFGLDMPPIRDVSEKKMKVALVEMGAVGLELIEDYSEDGSFAKFVKERGNAIHHFCLLTDDIEADIAAFEKRGVEMADKRPRVGLRGKKIAFSRPGALNGIPFELSEP